VDDGAPVVRAEADAAGRLPAFCADPLLAWAVEEAWGLPSPEAVFDSLGALLEAEGFDVCRLFCVMDVLHPLYIGRAYRWARGGRTTLRMGERQLVDTPAFRLSPGRAFLDGAREIRRRLDDGRPFEYPVYEEIAEEGGRDYLALHLPASRTGRNFVSFATDRPAGFGETEVERLRTLARLLGRVVELHMTRLMATDLLDVYVGRAAGARILDGQIIRGTGETITAAVWMCDLRDFTGLSNRLPRDVLIEILDTFFETMAAPVREAGGEILKFIGDAVLAIFPLRPGCGIRNAANQALGAAFAASARMEALNAEGRFPGAGPLRYGLALHIGDVMWGNVGAPDRLDFTAIGPAVNFVSRLEGVAGGQGYSIVLSRDFVEACGALADDRLLSIGAHRFRGFEDPHEVFTLAP
jgi:adenylate cyclase